MNNYALMKKHFPHLCKKKMFTSLLLSFRLQFSYGTSPATENTKFGYTDSGYQVQVTLVKDEFIQELNLDFTLGKPFLTRVLVKTNLRTLGPYGGEGGQTFIVRGNRLMYLDGMSGALINQLTAFFDRCL